MLDSASSWPVVPVELSEVAQREAFDAAVRYEEERPGRGLRFLAAISGAAANLEDFPHLGTQCFVESLSIELRRVRLQRFPYFLYYLMGPDPFIIAVAHTRQDPFYFIDRLS